MRHGPRFGELALMYNTPRSASCIAATECTAWTLDRSTFRAILAKHAKKRALAYKELLKKVILNKDKHFMGPTCTADGLHHGGAVDKARGRDGRGGAAVSVSGASSARWRLGRGPRRWRDVGRTPSPQTSAQAPIGWSGHHPGGRRGQDLLRHLVWYCHDKGRRESSRAS